MKVALTALCLAAVIISSCKRDDDSGGITVNAVDTTVNDTVLTIDDLPLRVGNWYRYRLDDSSAGTADTIKLTISSTTQNGDTSFYHCLIHNDNALVDSGKFAKTADTITYRGKNGNSLFGDFKLVFPAETGDSWTYWSVLDTFRIVSFIRRHAVLDKRYDVLYIQRRYTYPNFYKLQDIHLRKGVGIVSQSIDYFNLAPIARRQKFQLIDFDVE